MGMLLFLKFTKQSVLEKGNRQSKTQRGRLGLFPLLTEYFTSAVLLDSKSDSFTLHVLDLLRKRKKFALQKQTGLVWTVAISKE
jgi:hypothetical protein